MADKLFACLLIVCLLTISLPVLPQTEAAPATVWSSTRPRINLEHIFLGTINRRGQAVGFHARPNGVDPPGRGVVSILSPANSAGIYVARVWISSRRKIKTSSFFPDSLDRLTIVKAILHAYRNGRSGDGRFRGPSGHGFTIEGYTLADGRINTAYPVYRPDNTGGTQHGIPARTRRER